MFPRYYIYSIGSTGQSTGTGGDRSINSFCSRVMLTVLLCLKNEKENKRKEIQKVIGGEGDENENMKIK